LTHSSSWLAASVSLSLIHTHTHTHAHTHTRTLIKSGSMLLLLDVISHAWALGRVAPRSLICCPEPLERICFYCYISLLSHTHTHTHTLTVSWSLSST